MIQLVKENEKEKEILNKKYQELICEKKELIEKYENVCKENE